MGSSPRMRGTPVGHQRKDMIHGIIPAYAGNTRWTSTKGHDSWDHPRVCGEHSNLIPNGSNTAGSSPRMRGTHLSFQALTRYQGIIPAYAGNTRTRQAAVARQRDHPRVCGEHEITVTGDGTGWGSSPRMRGTHRLRKQGDVQPGIIPAYAGNTRFESFGYC